jgi:S-adenosylmethionine synthetase
MHAGLTGRKTAEDTYGEFARHSQTALSGKDPSRIGRSGAYVARYGAANIVAAGLADECELQLSYSLGSAGPISIQVETFGTGRVPGQEIVDRLRRNFDFRLATVIRKFNLRYLPAEHSDGFYRKLAVYGQVGRPDLALPWEATADKDLLA